MTDLSSTGQEHPITPPTELVEQWADDMRNARYFATQAARWGADQELEACCDFLQELLAPSEWITGLRAARRPKPPSLKEQALAVVENSAICDHLSPDHATILRRALETLDD